MYSLLESSDERSLEMGLLCSTWSFGDPGGSILVLCHYTDWHSLCMVVIYGVGRSRRSTHTMS